MSKSPIIFGSINKKLLLPFLLAIGQTVYKIFNKYYPEKKYDLIAHFYTLSLAQMSIRFIPYIFRFYNKEGEKKILYIKKKL